MEVFSGPSASNKFGAVDACNNLNFGCGAVFKAQQCSFEAGMLLNRSVAGPGRKTCGSFD